MKFIEKYQEILHNGIYIIQAIAYTISFVIISVGIIKTAILYGIEYIDPNIDDLESFTYARLSLSESSALALSFILGVEILKLFYIKTYKQLIIVISLVIIKLSVNYFLLKEINIQIEKTYN
jgi:uncharacterized membrane protein